MPEQVKRPNPRRKMMTIGMYQLKKTQNRPHDSSEEGFSKGDILNIETNDNVAGLGEKLQH
jgi:hypothetical protein